MGNEDSISILQNMTKMAGADIQPKPFAKSNAKSVENSKASVALEDAVEKPQAESEIPKEQIELATKRLNEHFASVARDLRFSVSDEVGTTIITVVDSKTDEVIRQIPSEDAVRMAQVLQDTNGEISSLVDDKA